VDDVPGRTALMGRRLALIAVTAAAVAIAAIPIVLTVTLGWYRTHAFDRVLVGGGGILLVLVLVYLVWLPAVVFGLVFVYDRLGLHYQPAEIEPKRPRRRERLRRRATAKAIAAEESARLAAQRAARERERSRTARQAERGTAPPPSAPRPRSTGLDGTPSVSSGEAVRRPAPPSDVSDTGDGRRRPKAG
jgi:hypothetical protein